MAKPPKSELMIESLQQRIGRIEDELAIRSLAARFSDCAKERDFEGFADLWSAYGVWEIGPPLPARAEGVDEIVDLLRRLLKPQKMFMQMTHSGVVHIDGDRAMARFVEREHARGENSFYENLAVYNDEIVREADGVWRFCRRTYVYRYLDDSPFSGDVFPLGAANATNADQSHGAGGRS